MSTQNFFYNLTNRLADITGLSHERKPQTSLSNEAKMISVEDEFKKMNETVRKMSNKETEISEADIMAKFRDTVSEESTAARDDKAEKAGRKVAKDIEYDEYHTGKDDNKAERAGRKVTKDIEYDEKHHRADESEIRSEGTGRLNELSKATLTNYVNKASKDYEARKKDGATVSKYIRGDDSAKAERDADNVVNRLRGNKQASSYFDDGDHYGAVNYHDKKASDRNKGVEQAYKKLTKEETDLAEESTVKRDNRAEKAGRRVTKDIEYDEYHTAKDDNKAERAGRKVAKDIEYDEKHHRYNESKQHWYKDMYDADDESRMGSIVKRRKQAVAEEVSEMEYVDFRSSDLPRWMKYVKAEGYEVRETGNYESYEAYDENGNKVGYFYDDFDLSNDDSRSGRNGLLLVDINRDYNSKSSSKESTVKRDNRAEKAGRKVTKDIEYDERVKDGIHGKRRGAEDNKAERAGRKVTKDIEWDELHEESTVKRDNRAEKAGRKVTKDIEYDERVKDRIHGKRRGAEDNKAERAGRKVTKDIEWDELHESEAFISDEIWKRAKSLAKELGKDIKKLTSRDIKKIADEFEMKVKDVSEILELGESKSVCENRRVTESFKKFLSSRGILSESAGISGLSNSARELVMFGDNDAQLYKSSYVPVTANLERKMKKGMYDAELARKLWKYHADRAAQAYAEQFGNGQPWQQLFSPAVRREAAAAWEEDFREESGINEGSYESGDEYGWDVPERGASSSTRRVSGRAYGGSSQGDSEEDTPVSTGEKKRGRPAGTGKKTGARGPRMAAESFDAEINPAKKGMFKGKTKAELQKQYNALKKSGPHKSGSPENTKMKELAFAIRAKSGWGKVNESDMGGKKWYRVHMEKEVSGSTDPDIPNGAMFGMSAEVMASSPEEASQKAVGRSGYSVVDVEEFTPFQRKPDVGFDEIRRQSMTKIGEGIEDKKWYRVHMEKEVSGSTDPDIPNGAMFGMSAEVKAGSSEEAAEKAVGNSGYRVVDVEEFTPFRPAERPSFDEIRRQSMTRTREVDEAYDPSWDPDYRPYQRPERDPDWDREMDMDRESESESEYSIVVKDQSGRTLLTFPSTGGFYGNERIIKSKGFDPDLLDDDGNYVYPYDLVKTSELSEDDVEYEDEDEVEDEWYDENGRVNPNGAYDVAGHFFSDRVVREHKEEYKKFSRELEKLITEGISVNVSVSTEGEMEGGSGQPTKNVSISATGEEADMLVSLLSLAGITGDSGTAAEVEVDTTDVSSGPTGYQMVDLSAFEQPAGQCSCDQDPCECESLEEDQPDWPSNTEYNDDALMYSGGLNGPKSTGQETGDPVPVHRTMRGTRG